MYDDALDAQIHKWYYDYLTDKSRKVWPPRGIPYFSPSAANSDARGLYEKMRGAKKEQTERPPHQGRWVRLGTSIGDMIQRDVLFAEQHYARHMGENPPFKFERNGLGEPLFEEFAKVSKIAEHAGQTFGLYGTGDGIMRVYVPELGREIRVGLEVKSKQTTYSMTSGFSARKGPKEDHVKQCITYSAMYGTPSDPLDYYVILYVNGSKKAWEMTPEDFEKSPDILAFGLHITDEMRTEVLDHFAGIVAAAEAGEPPKLDIDKWTFNNFKQACALSLSPSELAEIERQVAALQRSNLPDHKKRGPAQALADIHRIRAEHGAVKEAA
ncbi:hypothetical protein [Paenibacillus tuaregi]|uniref:hypothetical protein n=1 Tax=Paenibacillus tuaregi TaxID=1816681 RepID=UPI000A5C1121|nr:hypothetical protein [Paenibacillus tuaregi]